MSIRRSTILGLVLAGALIAPAAAVAQPTLSIAPTAQLGPQGASAVISVDYSCDSGSDYATIYVVLAQSNGNRLVRADGSASVYPYGTLVCDSTTHTAQITVTDYYNSPLKQGKATATATLTEYDYDTGQSYTATATQQVSLKK